MTHRASSRFGWTELRSQTLSHADSLGHVQSPVSAWATTRRAARPTTLLSTTWRWTLPSSPTWQRRQPRPLQRDRALGHRSRPFLEPSTDDVGVTGYDVFRDGALIASTGPTPAFADNTVSPHTSYYYQVRARDAAGNASPQSGLVTLVTPAVFTDDFESGDLSRWTSAAGLTVQQDVVANGTSAARATSSGTGASAYRQLASGQSDTYYRLRFDVVSRGELRQPRARSNEHRWGCRHHVRDLNRQA